jgi:hypothetical protein
MREKDIQHEMVTELCPYIDSCDIGRDKREQTGGFGSNAIYSRRHKHLAISYGCKALDDFNKRFPDSEVGCSHITLLNNLARILQNQYKLK